MALLDLKEREANMKYLILLSLLFPIGCGFRSTVIEQGTPGHSVVFLTTSILPTDTVNCPEGNGGTAIVTAVDTNDNLKWDPTDANQTIIVTCNGATGSQGASGTNGSNGVNGTNGTNGVNGTNGSNGTNAVPTTTVQFCPGYTQTSYPEYGICINSNIYAVYWDGHNSWLALISPGYYASTSTNAACNFTVDTNCSVH